MINFLNYTFLFTLISFFNNQIFTDNFFNTKVLLKEETRVIKLAEKYLVEKPITITNFVCERSVGGLHDFYSEGDYWWENPNNPTGAYIRKDGLTNPNNFTAHRKVMRRLSIIVPALVAAYKITHDDKYVKKAIEHLSAWFINSDTKMNPNLLYAQAIKGKVTGRGIGIIDTIHLIEVVQSIIILNNLQAIDNSVYASLKKWFSDYLGWLTTHQYGIDERDHGNNHSTWWAVQVAMFAKLADDKEMLNFVNNFYKKTLLPNQMDTIGSFPKELTRTKPFDYSIFNLDAMIMICEITSTERSNLWNYETNNGRGIRKGIEFLFPFLLDKNKWTYKKDIMYWDELPIRSPSLLFASIHFNEPKYFSLWEKLSSNSQIEEIIRNFPIRQPLLWINNDY